ncbi:MAG: farnesyl-diphosphate synthase [Rhodospirillales bacterium 12-54-5]|nr:MAG: farnesyl-diphosphate synthase [Rhodospirillales bacterium 12-54-5]
MDELLPSQLAVANKVISMTSRVEETEQGSAPEGEGKVMEAMRYSALAGGKRLRPFLTVESAKLFGVNADAAMMTAAAMEFVHTYSLIHDDLPAMDNDDFRRGKPSCHKQFGEAAAILAGDALLTYAFEVLSNPRVHADANVRCELIRSVARAAGVRGMVGGQMMDLDAEHQALSAEEVIRLQRLKTGEMFAVSCEAGAILGKAPDAMRSRLQRYAHDIGLAFQITDDLLDEEGTRTETGKGVRKDKTKGKATLISVLGIERAREQANTLAEQAASHLKPFDERANTLRALASFVVTRRN